VKDRHVGWDLDGERCPAGGVDQDVEQREPCAAGPRYDEVTLGDEQAVEVAASALPTLSQLVIAQPDIRADARIVG
jgi:hypothetical protein